ncbi:MAG TPA: tetratricopeptide repeat protein, partial [Armatimonadota bacterium]|nr:tetratricopeptide repeat protein [Armatimonadota bacterium]
ERWQEALALKLASGDPMGTPLVMASLGQLAQKQGDLPGARARYEEALAFARAQGDEPCTAMALDHLGLLAAEEGDPGRARALCEEALAIRRRRDSLSGVSDSLLSLSRLAVARGSHEEAARLLRERVEVARETTSRRGLADALTGLADHLVAGPEPGAALTPYVEALEIRVLLGDTMAAGSLLARVAEMEARRGEYEAAARLAGASSRCTGEAEPSGPALEAARTRLGSERFRRALADGEGMGPQEALFYVRSRTHPDPG